MRLSLRKRSMKPRRGSTMAGLKAMIPTMGCHQSYCSVHMPGAHPTSNRMKRGSDGGSGVFDVHKVHCAW